ncbi:YybH family protein [Psychroserpens jangbogonensis]|uniref:YybH family protein n=1 Tax=Psychroserpens jangbogonensis TaxID=1484460 RepID=UPI00053DE1A7|nr:nuclear transport factor 2 family protein [Psychroserpens jangbogonensis]
MKNKFVKGIVFGSLVLLMTSCNTNEEKSTSIVVDKEQVKIDIQARENQFAELLNSGELKKIGYYADDAVTFYQNMAPVRGKKERYDFFKRDIAVNNKNKISITTTEVFPSKDGVQVLEIGYYTVVDSTNTAINTGNYMSLFEKRDGQYVCLRDMSASDMPID